jgi:hypothetical protein
MKSRAKYSPSYTIEKNLDASDWFEEVTGMEEKEWMDRRGEFIELGAPVDGDSSLGHHLLIRHTGGVKLWDAGAFRVWSLNELETAAESKWTADCIDAQAPECEFEIHIRHSNDIRPVEVSSLQADAGKAENQELGSTMFQVASNFNCCENASYRRPVDNGNFVTNLMADSTQGPAAASGAGKRTRHPRHATRVTPPNQIHTKGLLPHDDNIRLRERFRDRVSISVVYVSGLSLPQQMGGWMDAW